MSWQEATKKTGSYMSVITIFKENIGIDLCKYNYIELF